MDWPITPQELEPYYAKAENKMGVTRTNGIPGLPGNNNFKVLNAGATKLGYKEVHTGNIAINSEPRDDRGRCMQLAGGYEMETLALGIPFMAAFLNPGGWGADFSWWLDHYTNLACREDKTTNQMMATLYEELTALREDNSNFTSFLRVCCLRYLSLPRLDEAAKELAAVRIAMVPARPAALTH